ncbi:MAG TPA: hypothetical protein VGS97_01150 [Actinocrinis sp.]|nr:hypothetical protein [Actinocrinis sp.]HEV2342673.1 hypothetical protein [Actinocrinis sp.]
MAYRIDTAERGRRVYALKRRSSQRTLPPLDLRTPSGRYLPY